MTMTIFNNDNYSISVNRDYLSTHTHTHKHTHTHTHIHKHTHTHTHTHTGTRTHNYVDYIQLNLQQDETDNKQGLEPEEDSRKHDRSIVLKKKKKLRLHLKESRGVLSERTGEVIPSRGAEARKGAGNGKSSGTSGEIIFTSSL